MQALLDILLILTLIPRIKSFLAFLLAFVVRVKLESF